MSDFQELGNVMQSLQRSISPSVPQLVPKSLNSQKSTLWVGIVGETPITAITIQDTKAELLLKAHIPDIHLMKLNIQISQETVLIQGNWSEAAEVEGCFRPYPFQNLVPLPHAVLPENAWTELESDGFSLHLTKQAEVQQSRTFSF